MTLTETMKYAREHRKEIADANERVRRELITLIEEARFNDPRWAFAAYPDEPMANVSRALHVVYETSRRYGSKLVKQHFRVVVCDGGKVSIRDQEHAELATANGAEHALQQVARLISEFEWPDELPDSEIAAAAS